MRSLAVASLLVCVSAMELQQIYMKRQRSDVSDLETSASGYAYHSVSGQPTGFVRFPGTPAVVQPPVHYVQQAAYLVPQLKNLNHYVINPQVVNDALKSATIVNEEIETAAVPEKFVKGDEESFEKEGGKEFSEATQSNHGEKGEKGYASKHGYEKGQKGSHENEGESGFYKENGGKKQGHHDAAGHYASHHEEGKGSKGGSFDSSGYHKKGQKTTGFHNVYHKDEYKKNHSFYDESGKSGHFDKYGNHHEHHKSEEGGHKKGGNSDSSYNDKQYGKKGFHDRGHYDDAAKGYKGEHGQEGYHSSHSDYANQAGKSSKAAHGYNNESGEQY